MPDTRQADTSTAPSTKAKRSKRRKVEHLYDRDAGAFAFEHGLQVRAFCGVWITFGPRSYVKPLSGLSDLRADDCRRCTASLRKRAREAGHRD